MPQCLSATACLCGVLPAAALAGTTIHVDDDACPDSGAGTPADPYCSIQTVLDGFTITPAENRQFNHWNTNPRVLDCDGKGRGLASGTIYLLPYYLGLYHSFIEETK